MRPAASSLYNIPGRTGSNILPETIARMAEKCPTDRRRQGSDRLAGPGVADRRAVRPDASSRGDDSLTLPLMSIGGRGVVSVVGNIVPRDMKALVQAFDGRASSPRRCSGTASCSRSAATCSAWRRTRSRSRRR